MVYPREIFALGAYMAKPSGALAALVERYTSRGWNDLCISLRSSSEKLCARHGRHLDLANSRNTTKASVTILFTWPYIRETVPSWSGCALAVIRYSIAEDSAS